MKSQRALFSCAAAHAERMNSISSSDCWSPEGRRQQVQAAPPGPQPWRSKRNDDSASSSQPGMSFWRHNKKNTARKFSAFRSQRSQPSPRGDAPSPLAFAKSCKGGDVSVLDPALAWDVRCIYLLEVRLMTALQVLQVHCGETAFSATFLF